ncbi:MAG: IS607 family transposase [Candidatus Scalindua sp.]|nr:IS607 family transposase [Candidatus Scalindua sp.]
MTPKTLRGWDARGLIDTIRSPTRQRLYDVRKYQGKTEKKKNGGHRVIYARVSSTKQRDDLERQVAALRAEFPQHQVVRDIGSGINWSRPGLRTVLRYCLEGSLRELVVAHRDRLSRLAFGLIEFLVAEAGGQLVVRDSGGVSENDELGEDLLSIVHIFSCRQYGRRKYGKSRGASRETTKKSRESCSMRRHHSGEKDSKCPREGAK